MSTIYLPLVAGQPDTPRMGYALYGVGHDTLHQQLDNKIPVQNWTANTCCLKRASYYPTIHSTLWLKPEKEYNQMAAQFPGRTWLLLNEPDVGPPQANVRPEYALDMVQHWTKLLRAYDSRIAGYGVTITPPDHWLNRRQHPWILTGWKNWLDEWNRIKGPRPDVAHIHIYASTRQQWQDEYSMWLDWNRKNWQCDKTIISECGESKAVYDYLTTEFVDPSVEVLLWFTNLADNPVPGLPPDPLTTASTPTTKNKGSTLAITPNIWYDQAPKESSTMHTGITITNGSETPRWRIVSARELTPEEKGDKHHVYIDLRKPDGSDARGTTGIKSGWEGMSEEPQIIPTDKPANEPAANVPIHAGEKRWVEVDAGTAQSDRIAGMDAYHAYEVIFQYDPGISATELPTPRSETAPPILTPPAKDVSDLMHNLAIIAPLAEEDDAS